MLNRKNVGIIDTTFKSHALGTLYHLLYNLNNSFCASQLKNHPGFHEHKLF